jgi:hypothetical protein
MEMGNSLAKLPLTSPWEQWEEEKQSNEDIYSTLAHKCNSDDAKALAPVKALEDPLVLGPLLQ